MSDVGEEALVCTDGAVKPWGGPERNASEPSAGVVTRAPGINDGTNDLPLVREVETPASRTFPRVLEPELKLTGRIDALVPPPAEVPKPRNELETALPPLTEGPVIVSPEAIVMPIKSDTESTVLVADFRARKVDVFATARAPKPTKRDDNSETSDAGTADPVDLLTPEEPRSDDNSEMSGAGMTGLVGKLNTGEPDECGDVEIGET